MSVVDLRSDTVTLPTEAMRRAMAAAEVGDDVWGEDPTVLRLQERAAVLLGKEAALFVPSGTMANQIALLCHCARGDEVVTGEGSHCVLYESGAGSAWAGVGFAVVGSGGLFTADDVRAVIRPPDAHFARTRLIAIENTHNRGGGRVFPQADVEGIAALARERGLALHLDGARIWNAACASGRAPAELAAPADTVSACFSKGLGAPIGSVIAGSRDLAPRAHRFRKMLGGGMRQVGILAAAALHALDHHVERLVEDHENARRLAHGLAAMGGVACEAARVETNIVNFALRRVSAEVLVKRCALEGVKLHAIADDRVRAVTHLGVSRADVDHALGVISRAIKG
jgi:threonine aldolase